MANATSGSGEITKAKSRLHARPRVKRSVAVTGADSFLGRNLVGLLEEDESTGRIVLLDVERPSTAGAKSRHYRIDLTQPAIDARIAEILAAEQVDTVVHLAFLSSPSHASAWAHELESVGTMHVLNACRERAPKKFIMLSQTLLYGAHASNPNYLTERHPTRGQPGVQFFDDKIDAEREARRFAASMPDTCVTILRLAPVLGPNVKNTFTRWLSRRFVPTMLGFDPLIQYVHEMDAVRAFLCAIARDVPGTFNIVGEGVLPVSMVVKLAGRTALPVPSFVIRQAMALLWPTGFIEAPAAFADFLRYVCVADGERAAIELGFRAEHTTREAVLDFGGALRLRDARLLEEGSP